MKVDLIVKAMERKAEPIKFTGGLNMSGISVQKRPNPGLLLSLVGISIPLERPH